MSYSAKHSYLRCDIYKVSTVVLHQESLLLLFKQLAIRDKLIIKSAVIDCSHSAFHIDAKFRINTHLPYSHLRCLSVLCIVTDYGILRSDGSYNIQIRSRVLFQ